MFKLGNFTFMNFMFKYQFSLNGFKIRLLPNVCMLCGAEGLIKKKKKRRKKNHSDVYISEVFSQRPVSEGGLPFGVRTGSSFPG